MQLKRALEHQCRYRHLKTGDYDRGVVMYGFFQGLSLSFALSIFLLTAMFEQEKAPLVEGVLKGHQRYVVAAAFDSSGMILASASIDGSVVFWDIKELKKTRELTAPAPPLVPLTSMAFSGNDTLVATGHVDKVVRICDAKTGKLKTTLEGHNGIVTTVVFGEKCALLVSGSNDKTVKIWDLAANSNKTLKGHTGTVWCVALSRDEKLVASGGDDGTVMLWDANTGQERLTFKGHAGNVRSVALSGDGKLLASASYDKTIKVWDLQTGREKLTLKGHTDKVMSVAFSGDCATLASASLDGTVRLWDAESGKEKFVLEANMKGVRSVSFSPGNALLAGGGSNGSVTLWSLVARPKKD